jgi:hypothetical protein
MLVVLVFHPAQMHAGRGDKSGTPSATQLLVPVGSRSIALSGASLATVSGLEALYWNPAGLARPGKQYNAMFSHMSYLADIGVDYVAFGTTVGDAAAFGLALKSMSFGEIPVTTEDQPDGTGELTSPRFMTIGGTFARQISDKISAGLTANFIYEKMGNVVGTSVAFNAGVQYTGLGGVEGLGVGVVVKNLGPQLKYDGSGLERVVTVQDALTPDPLLKIDAAPADLPSTIEIGLGYTTPVSGLGNVTLETTFQNNNYSDDEYKFGIETDFRGLLFGRLGYAFASERDGGNYLYGFTGGLGVRTAIQGVDVQFGYAFRSAGFFAGNHVFDLILAFQ